MHQHGIERVSGADLPPPCSLNKAQAQIQGFCMKNGACEQVLKDAQQLADNRAARRIGQRLGKAGRIVRPVGIMLNSINVAQAFREGGNRIDVTTGRATSGLAGGAAGSWGVCGMHHQRHHGRHCRSFAGKKLLDGTRSLF